MTPDLDLALRCQRVLDIAAATRREHEARREFGHSPIDLDRDDYDRLVREAEENT